MKMEIQTTSNNFGSLYRCVCNEHEFVTEFYRDKSYTLYLGAMHLNCEHIVDSNSSYMIVDGQFQLVGHTIRR